VVEETRPRYRVGSAQYFNELARLGSAQEKA
jgi:hypothetical protein